MSRTAKSPAGARADRLAAALRENLRRRKQQSRDRDARGDGDGSGDPAVPEDPSPAA